MGRGSGPARSAAPARRARLEARPPDDDERQARHDVVLAAARRDRGCLAKVDPAHRCVGGLVGHELRKRSQRAGAHLDVDNVVTVCQGANGLVEDFPDWGWAIGLVVRNGEDVELARARREAMSAGRVSLAGVRRPLHRGDGTVTSVVDPLPVF